MAYTDVYTWRRAMPAIKVGVREFREQFARYLESDTPVAVTRRGETIGVYVPTPRKQIKSADFAELKAAADRLAAALADVDEEEFVAEFKALRQQDRESRRK
jgi:antitoxin (DNA-binding transcriptional repressor) of toxin-antitoxin stability system